MVTNQFALVCVCVRERERERDFNFFHTGEVVWCGKKWFVTGFGVELKTEAEPAYILLLCQPEQMRWIQHCLKVRAAHVVNSGMQSDVGVVVVEVHRRRTCR